MSFQSLILILGSSVSILSACNTFTASSSGATVTYTLDECTDNSASGYASSIKVYCNSGQAYAKTYLGSSTCSSGSQGGQSLSWYEDSGYSVQDCCASGGSANDGGDTSGNSANAATCATATFTAQMTCSLFVDEYTSGCKDTTTTGVGIVTSEQVFCDNYAAYRRQYIGSADCSSGETAAVLLSQTAGLAGCTIVDCCSYISSASKTFAHAHFIGFFMVIFSMFVVQL